MKDFNDVELKEGDLVAYLPPNYRHLIRGRVIGFTPKMIVIEREPTAQIINYYAVAGVPIRHTIDRREPGYVTKLG